MEHCDKEPLEWRYRIRWPESGFPDLREWTGQRLVQGATVFVPLMDPNVAPEVEWRPDEKGGAWRAAEPHRFRPCTERFVVKLTEPRDFRADPVLRVSALVRGCPSVYDLTLPARELAVEGEECFDVEGVAILHGPGQLLYEPNEFRVKEGAWSVVNITTGGQAALRSCDPEPPSVGPRFPGVMLRAGRLPDSEVEALMEWKRQRDKENAC